MPRSHHKIPRSLSQHSGAAGGSLVALASRKGGFMGVLLALVGAGLLYKAVSSGRSKQKRLPATRHSGHTGRDIHLSSSVSINRPAKDLYDFWKDFSNLPKIMSFLERVEPREGKVSHWVARVPAGPALEWDSEIVEDTPPHQLSWRSLEDSDLQTWGTVVFEPRGEGTVTEVSVSLNFNPPGGPSGSAAAKFLKGLEASVLSKNLQNLKAHMETGEIPTNKHFDSKRFGNRGPA